MEYFLKSLEIRKNRDESSLRTLYDNLGDTYYNLREYYEALKYFSKLADVYQKDKLPEDNSEWAYLTAIIGLETTSKIYRKRSQDIKQVNTLIHNK